MHANRSYLGAFRANCAQSGRLWPWRKCEDEIAVSVSRCAAGQVRPMQTQCRSDSKSQFWANYMRYYQNGKPL